MVAYIYNPMQESLEEVILHHDEFGWNHNNKLVTKIEGEEHNHRPVFVYTLEATW